MKTPSVKTARLLLAAAVAALSLSAPACVYYPGENAIAIDTLPAPVRGGINRNYPGAELLSAEREIQDENLIYQVEILHQSARKEVNIAPDGAILKVDLEDD